MFFCTFYSSSLWPLQSHKMSKHIITILCSNNSNRHDNRHETLPTTISYHFPDAVQFLQYITLVSFITPRERDTEQVLFIMRVDRILGYFSLKTSHYSSLHSNNNGKSSEEVALEVSLGEESRGHGSLETSHSSSSDCGDCEVVDVGLLILINRQWCYNC